MIERHIIGRYIPAIRRYCSYKEDQSAVRIQHAGMRPSHTAFAIMSAIGMSFAVHGTASAATSLVELAETSEQLIEHCDETIAAGDFLDIFVCGDELFEVRFNALDGGGMDVGDGGRYTRVPRMDLQNWANTIPERATGPNAMACNVCHTTETIGGAGDGAGPPAFNAIRDFQRTGNISDFIQRNVPHLFGMAGPQLVAEEMTEDLQLVRSSAIDECVATNAPVVRELETKDVQFGSVMVNPPCGDADILVQADGVADDLVVRPFQWKGVIASVREFSRDAFHNELGMTPVELAGDGVDSDFDGVVDEISIDDVTAMAIYLAAQPRPSSLMELDWVRRNLLQEDGGAELVEALSLPSLTRAERQDIRNGRQLFGDAGCADCHVPALRTERVVFSEPSINADFRDPGDVFPAGQSSADIAQVAFDITTDVPDNQIELGSFVHHMGNFDTDDNGHAIVRMYGDLKQHDMGPELAENIDEAGNGASMWMTKELWGLGNTAPYLHDGRATTIEEAIQAHGGDAANSAANFSSMSVADRTSMLNFLNNLVLFFPADEEE